MTREQALPGDLYDWIERKIEEGVAKAMRSAPLRNASISEGGTFTIKGGQLRVLFPAALGGGVGVYFGDLYAETTYVGTGLLVQRPDTTDIASFSYSEVTGTHTANLHDGQRNVIVGNDSLSDQGLARPYVPAGGWARARYGDWNISTTSGTFETLWRTEMFKQHPRLSVATLSSVDTSGSTGELRVLVDGVQMGTTKTIGFAQTTSLIGPAAVAGAHMKMLTIEVQGRMASGAGSLKVEPLHCVGRQS